MSDLFVFVNHDLVPASEASLLVSDLAIQRGYGIFDFLKTIDHTPIFPDEHLERFLHSARQLRLDAGRTKEELLGCIRLLMEKNKLPHSGIKLTLTGGYSPDGYALIKPNFVITQSPLQFPLTGLFEKGLRLVSYPHQRQMPDTKTIDYLMAIWLQPYIRERNADDVLYHQGGLISECPRSNFFIVTNEDEVVTPFEGILKGVIRGKVLKVAGRQFKTAERPVTLEEAWNAKEAFITSTTKHVVPVLGLDGRIIGDGAPGKVTRWISEGLGNLVKGLVQRPYV
ncbi:aminotransferase class IV [Flavitalea sp. BT771]|uniref:aminotransferase class IV n=1 Tax=Flavitalea sp. BT771 TaxID=3063329 RepID=UPI0026E1A03E|nr:aminotransferase class IV [Flavitalea sp. BT771]MDO6429282.1 aminotransferase class IV [Flavitalea sp. BT771]MDV6218590.1 aminotransferase class IV [Flavitalea sp. BT771]